MEFERKLLDFQLSLVDVAGVRAASC